VKKTAFALLVVVVVTGGGLAVERSLQAQAGQGATPPLSTFAAPAWSDIPLNPNQPDRVTYWSVDAFAKAHAELASRAAKGQPLNARDLLPLPMTRTHGYTVGYRTGKEPPTAEQHEGVTDVYFVMGGSATLTTGGALVGKRTLIDGEYRGTSVEGGESHRLKAGDVVLVPPNLPHAAQADAGGFSYLLLKINVGLYPWPIVAGGFGVGDVGAPLAPNQPEKAIYWSVDDFRRQHRASAARAAAGPNEPRANLPGGARCANLPLEYQGDCSAGCKGGTTIQLKAGDVMNMPPNTEHWVTEPEPSGPDAGFTYMLFKINSGLYPWQLVDFDF